jgi:hypothetical protein
MADDSEYIPTKHEPPFVVQERLRLNGYDWRGMTIIGIDAALREIRNRENHEYTARVKPASEPRP